MIVLYSSLIFCCVWLGVVQARRLKAKQKFYEDMLGFLRSYEHNLSFAQKEFRTVINDYVKEREVGEEFKRIIFFSDDVGLSREFISLCEEREAQNILSSLGKSDEQTEIKMLGSMKLLMATRLEDAKKRVEKYSTLSIKLSLLVGILLVILLL